MKPLLQHIVSQHPNAFVQRRQISDNIMLATELSHFLFRRRRGKKGFLSWKLNISKAYDRIEWGYLENVMLRLGFCRRWVDLIMTCVSIVSYAFLIHGVPKWYLYPLRGLRQGDPLSPYLFLLCTEGLSALIEKKQRDGHIQGISICSGAPPINHFLFTNDNFLFARVTPEECRQIMLILHKYEIAWGQKINLQKSEVSFSRNIKRNVQNSLTGQLRVNRVERHDRYLGLPPLAGRNKGQCFNFIKEHLWKQL